MKKSRIAFWGGISALVIVLVIGFGWFWSAGSVKAEFLPSIRVQVTGGTVSYKASGSSDWHEVNDVQEVHAGDSVKTGAASEAQILWGDLGVTRLDENSEVVVASAPTDASGQNAIINLKVNAGRVWSRMLKLLDVGSTMQVQTSDVVATVRGTSFGIIKTATGTEAAVSESVVGMSPLAGGDETLLSDNQWGRFTQAGKPEQVRKLTDKDAWPAAERQKDEKFDRDYLADMRKRFEARVASLPSAPKWIRDASESLHLALKSGDAKKDLALDYAREHLALGDIDGVRARLNTAGDKSGNLRAEVHAMATLLSRTKAMPDTVESFRGLRDSLVQTDASDKLYRGLVRIDEGIDDYLDGNIDQNNKTEAAASLISRIDQAEQDIKNQNLNDDRLNEKTKALRKRLGEALGIAPDNLPKAEPPAEAVTPTSKPPLRLNEPTLNPPVIKQAPITRLYQRIQLLASPSSVVVGSPVKLSLFGVTSAGQTDDITSQASFSSTGGSILGAVFTPSIVGTLTINASFTDGQGTRIATASVTATKTAAPQGVYLKSVSVVITGSTSVACGASFPFKVMGTYSDGKTVDVTLKAKVSTSDSKVLYAGQGTIMTFCPSDPQVTATISATVTDGLTQSGALDITVMRDPNSGSNCTPAMRRAGAC